MDCASECFMELPWKEDGGVGLGIHQLCFFLGAGFAPAISGTLLAFREEASNGALNPPYSLQPAPAFFRAFLVGVVVLLCTFFTLLCIAEVKYGSADGDSLPLEMRKSTLWPEPFQRCVQFACETHR